MIDKSKFVKITENKIEGFFEENLDEQSIFKALTVYDSLTKQFNNLFELMEDWYALQNYKRYKELNDNYKFVKYLTEKNITELKKDIFISKSLSDDDLKLIKEFAEIANSMYSAKSKIENFITKRTKELYPNLSNILGPIITARLLNMTKNLKHFAELPSSTIQMIGAEAALFRHLKYKKKPPKYGFLCEHPLMTGLNDHNKGKLARIMANKIALAAKLDLNKKPIDEKIKKDIEEKAKSLKQLK